MKTFLDSGVLLTAWRGKEPESTTALSVLDDDRREFLTSQMVKLELVPKPAFHKQRDELEFYETHFKSVKGEEPFSADLGKEAFELAKKHGLAAADALNIAAAIRQGAQEFITSETVGKPLFRVSGIKVVSLHSLSS